MGKINMKTILAFLLIIAFSCSNETTNNPAKPEDKGWAEGFGLSKVNVDSCQYVIYLRYNAATMVHAGDCNNPKHAR
jgi:hypothetical protein